MPVISLRQLLTTVLKLGNTRLCNTDLTDLFLLKLQVSTVNNIQIFESVNNISNTLKLINFSDVEKQNRLKSPSTMAIAPNSLFHCLCVGSYMEHTACVS